LIITYTSDLHGNKELYDELFDLAERKKAGAVIIGGDMLPKRGPLQHSLQEQKAFIFDFLKPALADFLSRAPRSAVYAMLGNDDWQASLVHLKGLEQEGLVHLIHGKKHDLPGGFELIGYAHVPPTPFTIKDGERRDLRDDVAASQRCTACCSQDTRLVVVDPVQYFTDLISIEEELELLSLPQDMYQCIYVMHAPPFETRLDRMEDGRNIGSRAVRGFIEKMQPYLTLHGHIHESFEMSGAYLERLGETICINPGQSTEELYAVTFELENIFETIEHTVFGCPA
jgi:Icc-related predicted phosphoesterase